MRLTNATEIHLRLKLTEGLISHFFANLALGSDADEALTGMDLGRPHHRILSVAALLPGITVFSVLEILRVTHQNLRLPMRKLIAEGLIELRPGLDDRRQRALHVTTKGRRLPERSRTLQWARFERAFREVGAADFDAFLRVQRALLDPKDAEAVNAMLATPLIEGP